MTISVQTRASALLACARLATPVQGAIMYEPPNFPTQGSVFKRFKRRNRWPQTFVRTLPSLFVASLLVGCGSDAGTSARPNADSTSTPTANAPKVESELVGEWQRINTCQGLVRGMTEAGLGKFAAEHVVDEAWVPRVTTVDQLQDPEHPCIGAAARKHGHFFTADGLFGSRDEDGNQVDDGTYDLPDDRTVVINKEFGKITFHFKVDGNQLFLTPVLPECAKKDCFAGFWAISVAEPGLSWNRVK